MYVEELALRDFRNYDEATIALHPEMNLVVGRNAQGKTNLLEALHCLGGMGSPRGPDAALIRDGAESAVIHGIVVREQRRVRVDLELRRGRGVRALVNGNPLARGGSLSELVVTVFFGPDELSLVKGSPDGRRRFFDELVVKLRPVRTGLRREWERALRQRNALLKTIGRRGSGMGASPAGLDAWDEALARAGGALTANRLHALSLLAPHAAKRYEEVAGGGRLELAYESTWLDEDYRSQATHDPSVTDEGTIVSMLRAALQNARARELERGLSLVGPHRDDVVVSLVSAGSDAGAVMDARSFASQGDQRTCALALKLAEHDLLTHVRGDRPILLLDDVFSELDPERRQWLSDAVRGLGQTFISSAEPGAAEAARAGLVIAVTHGHPDARSA